MGEGGQGKQSEGSKRMGQKGGPCKTGRRTEWDRCAGQHTKKNRRPDRANRAVRSFWVLCSLPAFEGQKKRNISKCEELVTWGRDRKRSSTHSLPLPARYYSAIPSFAQPSPRPKKSETHTEAEKCFLEGLVREIRKKRKKIVGWLRILRLS